MKELPVPVVEVIGWIAAVSSASLAVPQGARIATTRSVAGVSVITWQTMLIAGLAWTAHGIHVGIAQIIWPNALLALTSAWVMWQLSTSLKLPMLRTWGAPALYAAAAVGIDVLAGPVAYGVVIFIPGAVGQLAQLRDILRSPDASGVSMGFLLTMFINQVLWLSFAVPTGERAIMTTAFPVVIIVAVSVIALARRRRTVGSPPARVS